MDSECKNQYLRAIVEKRNYFSKSKEEKSNLLDEYCATTGLNRNYVIRKIQNRSYLKLIEKKKRKEKYDSDFVGNLIVVWEYFNRPCGQRLEKLLKRELTSLREAGEIEISDKIAKKLKQIGSSTIDLKLRAVKEKRS